ncbi:MAG: urease accessory protein UreD [Rhodospirillales bacterium]|nr:urease accessory protein UreD [Rhodospirillales bacterium]
MYDATSPSEPAAATAMHGSVELAFCGGNGGTRLTRLYQRAPLRVLFPVADACGIKQAVLLTTSGGLVGGDRLDVRVAAKEGAAILVTPQAAEKVYRSLGPDCRIDVRLAADADSWLEWLPQETILFDGAHLDRSTVIDTARGARVLAGEMLVFGRRARGETLRRGRLREAWQVRRDGRLLWADTLKADGDLHALLAAPACLAGAAAAATAIYLGEGSDAALALARDLTATGDAGEMAAAASLVGGLLVVRWLAKDARLMRDAFGRFWAAMRRLLGGWPEVLPRVWCI